MRFIFSGNFLDDLNKAFLIEDRYEIYLKGLLATLEIAALATIIGIVLGLLLAMWRVGSGKHPLLKVLSAFSKLYTTVIRGTPVILQIIIIYNIVFTSRDTNGILVGGICFGLNSAAYVSEIFRGAIHAVDVGQMEAGRSLGFSYVQTMWYIIIPQAIRHAVPALGNEFITLIKETSVASVIAVNELMKAAQDISTRTWDIVTPYLIVGVMYLLIVVFLQFLQKKIERHYAKADG